MAIYPVASSADGGIIYSDGSIQYSTDSSAIASSTAGYPVYPSTSSGDVLGTTDTSTTTTTTAPTTSDPGTAQPLPQPEYDWDSLLAPAYAAYDQTQNLLQQNLNASLGQADADAQTQREGLALEEQQRLGDFQSQRTREEGRTSSMIDEARRQASQLQQGIQSRYGGTTGTGRFVSEIVGSQAMANIGKNQEALQYTMGEISRSEENLKNTVMQMNREIDTNLANTKLQLRNNFNERIAEIGQKKGMLASEVAQIKLQLLNEYQQYVRDVAAQAQARKEQLYDNYVKNQTQLARLREQAQQDYSALLEQPAFNVGDTQYKWIPGINEPQLATGKLRGSDEDDLLGTPNF